jgi:hypothetical protein
LAELMLTRQMVPAEVYMTSTANPGLQWADERALHQFYPLEFFRV